MDIDILFFGNEIVNENGLIIPHPELHKRKFVLIPLAEIAPDFIHPVIKKRLRDLLAECNDSLMVELFNG
jgi:2-amino-4-hydroxy-6-hydroxymethyldihydropteridine diphosphokinase